PLERVDQPTEAWWDLSPLHPGRFGPWRHVLEADSARLPLYLTRPRDNYWFDRIAGTDDVYFQFNRSANASVGENLPAFRDRLLADLRSHEPRRVIVDLRFNTGGDLTLGDSLF